MPGFAERTIRLPVDIQDGLNFIPRANSAFHRRSAAANFIFHPISKLAGHCVQAYIPVVKPDIAGEGEDSGEHPPASYSPPQPHCRLFTLVSSRVPADEHPRFAGEPLINILKWPAAECRLNPSFSRAHRAPTAWDVIVSAPPPSQHTSSLLPFFSSILDRQRRSLKYD